MVHSIFLAYLLGLTIFFYNLAPNFLWATSRSYTFHLKSMHFFHPIILVLS